MGFQSLETGIGARIAAVRQARGAMSQQDLAEMVGVSRMTVHRWEAGAQVPQKKVNDLAAALRVPVGALQRPTSEADTVCDLLVQAGAILEDPPEWLGPDCPACVWFSVRFDVLSRLRTRVVVLCAPLVGQHQVRRLLAAVANLGLVHHVMLVSEEPADRSASWEVRKAEPCPELHVLRRAELEGHLFSLSALAGATLALAETLPAHDLELRMAYTNSEAHPQPLQSALWCWLSEQDHPHHLVLVGAPGSGKTVAARRFAVALAAAFLEAPEQRPCPVYVQLWSLLDATDLRQRLASEIQVQLGLANRAPVERALDGGRLVLILDGYDELVGRNPARLYAVERALRLLLRLPGRVLLTARTPLFFAHPADDELAHPGPSAPLPVRLAALLPLERQQVVAHLARLPDGGRAMLDLIRQLNLMDLAASPYVLDILFEGAPHYLRPFSGGQPVLSNLLNRRYQAWIQDDAPHFQRSSDDLRRLLGGLAATLRRVARVRGFKDDLDPELRAALFPSPDATQGPPPSRSRFLSVDHEGFQFVHLRMEEFFFASWVADQIREQNAGALLSHWIDRHDLTLLSGMLRDRAISAALIAWATDGAVGEDLRELSVYLLAFTGDRDRALVVLSQIAASPEAAGLRETARFALAAQGDRREVDRTVNAALAPHPTSARQSARLELLSLGLHETLLPAAVQGSVREALLCLDPDELQRDLTLVARGAEASVTSRAAALTALGYLGDRRSAELIRELLDGLAVHGMSGRSPALTRLTMAARLALQLVGAGRFPVRPPGMSQAAAAS